MMSTQRLPRWIASGFSRRTASTSIPWRSPRWSKTCGAPYRWSLARPRLYQFQVLPVRQWRISLRSGLTAMRRSGSSRPSANRTRVPFGLIWIPAPTSPSCVDCSYTSTSMQCLSRARVVTSPPMPPPTTTTLFNAVIPSCGSIRLSAREFHDLLPFFGFRGDERTEFRGRACQCRATEVGKLSLYLGIGKAGVDLTVERLDDIGGRVARRPDAIPLTGLEPGHEIGERRKIRQRRFAGHRGHGKTPKLSGPDEFDGRRNAAEQHLHLAGEQIGKCQRQPFIRDLHHVDAREQLEQLARHVRGPAVDAGRQ